MTNKLNLGAIHVKDVNLWAHVGILERERLLGQNFSVDFSIWFDFSYASKHDDLSSTVDYAIAIKGLQKLAFTINCLTIEKFSDLILDFLEELYGALPMKVLLRKCDPPIEGFTGIVEIERSRNLISLD